MTTMPLSFTDGLNRTLRQVPPRVLYVAGAIVVVWLYWLGFTGGLGVEPVEVIEHKLGLWALWMLLAALAISPLKRHTGLNLMPFRRALGLLAFYFAVIHVGTWAFLDAQSLSGAWADILKRPYITAGALSFLALVPLALTSTDQVIQRMGPVRWRRLHQGVYLALLLAAAHFVMVRKGWQLEPLIYLAVAVGFVMRRYLVVR